jgi:hypothetical protein
MGVVFVTGWTLFLFEGSFMPETVARGMDLLKVLSIGDKSPFHSSTLGQSSFPYAHLWERHENGRPN